MGSRSSVVRAPAAQARAKQGKQQAVEHTDLQRLFTRN